MQHWWHPTPARACARASRTTCSGCPTSRPPTSTATGDAAILDEAVPFLECAPARAGRARVFGVPTRVRRDARRSTSTACARSTAARPTGPHGLPLMGDGDWNDGMNRVGARGAWRERLGGLVPARTLLDRFAPIWPSSAATPERAERCRAEARRLGRGGGRARLGRRLVSPRLLRRRHAARLGGERRVPDRRDRAVLGGDRRRRRPGARARGDALGRAAPGARRRRPDPAARRRLRPDRARPRLHQGLRARRARERRAVHPRRALGRAGRRRCSATATRAVELFDLLNPINHARTPGGASSATGSSRTSSRPTSTPRRSTSGAAAGRGTPARPAGCTASPSRRSSACACWAIASASTRRSRTTGRASSCPTAGQHDLRDRRREPGPRQPGRPSGRASMETCWSPIRFRGLTMVSTTPYVWCWGRWIAQDETTRIREHRCR